MVNIFIAVYKLLMRKNIISIEYLLNITKSISHMCLCLSNMHFTIWLNSYKLRTFLDYSILIKIKYPLTRRMYSESINKNIKQINLVTKHKPLLLSANTD